MPNVEKTGTEPISGGTLALAEHLDSVGDMLCLERGWPCTARWGELSSMSGNIAAKIRAAARKLCRELADLRFGAPVTHVYNPLEYARRPHNVYVRLYGADRKRVIFLGMNPGPFGMAQTGAPKLRTVRVSPSAGHRLVASCASSESREHLAA